METEQQKQLDPMVSVIKKLESEGFVTQFQASGEELTSLATNTVFKPEDVRIADFYRFEGQSDPEDNSIVYAIETNTGEKGTLIDGFSNSSDPEVSSFLLKVQEIQKVPRMTGDDK
ncbi:MAG TPA: hypothetical protein VHO90_20160 [Bacteroidales bacterium]|nr:hypothetical protein [Bacteroidales bacterium]